MNRKHKVGKDVGGFALHRAGMSLVELLACLAIVAILGAMLIMVLQGVREKAKSSQCASNLRQIGMAMQLYAGDHDGRVDILAYKGAGTSVNWLDMLRGYVTPNYDRSKNRESTQYLPSGDVSACPAFAPYENSNDSKFCYGAAQQTDDPYSLPQPAPDMVSPSRQIMLSMVDNSAEYWILADSYHPDYQAQFYSIDRKFNRYGVHLRHDGRAGVLFLDGHVDMLDGAQFKQLRYNSMNAGYDGRNEAVAF